MTTLTKRMAEDLTEYMHEAGIRVRYMHSDIETLERIEIIRDLRLGAFDVLIGINLLREGLDIPECALVAILDADKEGFLRSETSLVQTIGRAARNVDGRVILYADNVTGSMERAMAETDRRREKQLAYNVANGITPESIRSNIHDVMASVYEQDHVTVDIGLADAPMVGPQPGGRHRGHGAAHAHGRGRPRVRDGGAAARRDQAAARHRARHCRRSAGAAVGSRGQGRRFKGARKYGPTAPRSARGERLSRIKTEYEPVQPTNAQSTAKPASRIKKPSLDDMGPGTDALSAPRAQRARRRTSIRAPRPALSARPCAGRTSRRSTRWARTPRCRSNAPRTPRPARTIDVPTEAEKKGRRGRPRKTGRPGQ